MLYKCVFQCRKNVSSNASLAVNTKSFVSTKTSFDPTTLYAVFLIGPSFTFPAVGMVMELVKDREVCN